ncbi:leukocyte elastase inhibitor A-like [Bradysia coprophila]|uniref:leukocyte elastase inhibitor A-like n=1 Tax=Bradysia coprophila TaxID=38358 RepID=UPI00187DD0C9|nr:leukocyte elastase inhibitor A-like [Bradysia coprophila]
MRKLPQMVCSIAASIHVEEFATSISNFGSNFYQQVIQSESGNLILSPYSVASALAFLLQASNGTTFDQMKNGLHLSGNKSSIADQYSDYLESLQKRANSSTLSVANQLYVRHDYKLNETFQDVAVRKFSAGVVPVDFLDRTKTAEKINRFVQEKTNDKIKEIVKPNSFENETRLFLVNAIYFKAKWEQKLTKTITGSFYTKRGFIFMNSAPADFMHSEHCMFNYGTLSDLDASALEMKYANSDFSFLIVLPDSYTGLSSLENQLQNYALEKITDQMWKQVVTVTIPKFKIKSEMILNNILRMMGMSEMFDGSKADFSGLLVSKERLYVSDAIHMAYIEIDGEGAEAAAVTVIKVETPYDNFDPPPPPIFVADHPFVFFILDDKTKTPIFSGRFIQPN